MQNSHSLLLSSSFSEKVIIGVSAAFLVWDAIDLGFTISDLVTHLILYLQCAAQHWTVAGAEEGEPVCEGVEGQGGDAEGCLGRDLGRVLPRHARVISSMSSMVVSQRMRPMKRSENKGMP